MQPAFPAALASLAGRLNVNVPKKMKAVGDYVSIRLIETEVVDTPHRGPTADQIRQQISMMQKRLEEIEKQERQNT